MSIITIIQAIWKRRRLLCFLVAVSIVACTVYVGVTETYKASIIIKFVGPKASLGQNADGTKLNPYEMERAFIVNEAIGQLGAENCESTQKIIRNIKITPIESNTELRKYESWIEQFSSYEEDDSDKKAKPVFFLVEFESSQSSKYAVRMLRAIVENYRKYYVKTYTNVSDILLITKDDIQSIDYYDAVRLIETKTNLLIEQLSNIMADKDVRSTISGLSVSTIKARLENLRECDVGDCMQYVLENGISKDSNVLVMATKQKVADANQQSIYYDEKAKTEKVMMQKFSEENKKYLWDDATLVKPSTSGGNKSSSGGYASNEENGQVLNDVDYFKWFSQQKTTYDTMALDYVDFSVKREDLKIDIKRYTDVVNYFTVRPYYTIDSDPETELMIEKLSDKYLELQEHANDIIDIYNSIIYERAIVFSTGVNAAVVKSKVIYYAVFVLVAIFVGGVFIFLDLLKLKHKDEN